MTPLLEVRGLTRSFGGLRAVAGAEFHVPAGSITGLIGPNGAGKTTTFDVIAGRLRPDAGHVRFDGSDVTGAAPERLARRGLVRTFQIPRVFGRMTVWENLLFGAEHPGEGFLRSLVGGGSVAEREREVVRQADEVLHLLELESVSDTRAAELSGGQRKLLELGRVLMLQPRLVLLDEPTAGVAPALTDTLVAKLRRLRDDGTTLLVVEHDLKMVMDITDHVVVMHLGQVLIEGAPEVVVRDERVLEAYLGGADV